MSIGLAGAADGGSARGRLIVASGAVQHDMDARPLTDARGVVARLGLSVFPADTTLSDMLQRAADETFDLDEVIAFGAQTAGELFEGAIICMLEEL